MEDLVKPNLNAENFVVCLYSLSFYQPELCALYRISKCSEGTI